MLPVFSLPGKYGIGGFSKESLKFIDFLHGSGQKYWQILPLGPTSYGDSPYQAFSTFALNPYFIDPDTLGKKGLVSRGELNEIEWTGKKDDIDYSWLYETRFVFLKKAFSRFKKTPCEGYEEFKKKNEDWVYDYALFMALKDKFGGVSFYEWPEDIRKREPGSLERYRTELLNETEFYIFLQYEAYSEWLSVKHYANERGIKIIGDIPIYVSSDSSDVWTGPELFRMDEEGRPARVAGCPPDGFSADGQLWGNPLYNWDYHKGTGYKWWCRRMEKCSEIADVVRIDHFRGFDEYYSIPAGDATARYGRWEKGPGLELFEAIKGQLGELEIIAEDLGFITDSVRRLVKCTGYPNMKVLEFAFDSRDEAGPSEYLPYSYDKNCVVYTGTHDNETLKGWLSSVKPEEVRMVRRYTNLLRGTRDELVTALIRAAESSTARLAIIPFQDWLKLGNEARINHPSTLGGNWRFRLKGGEFKADLKREIKEITTIYGRS